MTFIETFIEPANFHCTIIQDTVRFLKEFHHVPMLTVIINILVENEVKTRYILMIINDISTDTTLRLFNVKTRHALL